MPFAFILAAAVAAGPPPVVDGFVLRPVFHTSSGDVLAGTAFGLDVGGRYVVVTAYHLFGPNGGLPSLVPPGEIPAFVPSATVVDAWTGARVGDTHAALAIPDARPMGDSAAYDLALFPMDRPSPVDALSISGKTTLRPAILAPAPPRTGDPVWVAAPLVGGAPDAPRVLPAQVVEVNADWVFYRFERADVDLTATSGAPVLDGSGRVVGVHLGGGKVGNELIGSANPLSAHADRVEDALGREVGGP